MNKNEMRDLLLGDLFDIETKTVPMPEWGEGVTITLKTISAEARDAYETQIYTEASEDATDEEIESLRMDKLVNIRSKFLMYCICDPDTLELIFAPEDAERFGQHKANSINKLFKVCTEMNGIENSMIVEVKN